MAEPISLKTRESTEKSMSDGQHKGATDQATLAPLAAEDETKTEKPQQSSEAPSQGPPPPPDGGLQAWMQVVSGFCMFWNTYGLLNAFGVFQTYYETELLHTCSASDISWIGTLQSCFILYGTIYSGPLYDWGYIRPLILVGCFLSVFGMFMTSLAKNYWEVILAQGLVMGLGLGCLFTPMIGTIAGHFSKKRGIALGIATTGSVCGGVLYPIIFNRLVFRIGFGWTVRVTAFIMLALSIIPVLTARMWTPPPAVRRLWDLKAWKTPEFSLYGLAMFIVYTGLYVPYFYIALFAREKGYVTDELNQYLLPIMNAGGLPGRLLFGHLADRLGGVHAFGISAGASAVLAFAWIGVVNRAGVIAFSVIYGFFSAGIITTAPHVVALLTPDMRQYGVRLGMFSVCGATGLLIGNPIAGAILTNGWTGLQGWSGTTLAVTFLIMLAIRLIRVGGKLVAKC